MKRVAPVKAMSPTRAAVTGLLALVLSACASLPEPDTTPSAYREADELLNQGVASYRHYRYRKSLPLFQQALRLYRRSDLPEGIAKSCLNLARVMLAQQRYTQAGIYLDRAQAALDDEPHNTLRAHLHIQRAQWHLAAQRFEAARDALAPVLDHPGHAGIHLAALQTRTAIAFASGDDDRADWLQRYRRAVGERDDHHRGRLLRFEARLTASGPRRTALLLAALHHYRRQANPAGAAAVLQELAVEDLAENRLREADNRLLRALYIRQQLRHRRHSLDLLRLLRKTRAGDAGRIDTWIERLTASRPLDWDDFQQAFDPFPHTRSR